MALHCNLLFCFQITIINIPRKDEEEIEDLSKKAKKKAEKNKKKKEKKERKKKEREEKEKGICDFMINNTVYLKGSFHLEIFLNALTTVLNCSCTY